MVVVHVDIIIVIYHHLLVSSFYHFVLHYYIPKGFITFTVHSITSPFLVFVLVSHHEVI